MNLCSCVCLCACFCVCICVNSGLKEDSGWARGRPGNQTGSVFTLVKARTKNSYEFHFRWNAIGHRRQVARPRRHSDMEQTCHGVMGTSFGFHYFGQSVYKSVRVYLLLRHVSKCTLVFLQVLHCDVTYIYTLRIFF